MKKILMTLVAAFAAVSMNAQTNMYIGGSLGYSTTSHDGSTLNTKFSFIPHFVMALTFPARVPLQSLRMPVTPSLTWAK